MSDNTGMPLDTNEPLGAMIVSPGTVALVHMDPPVPAKTKIADTLISSMGVTYQQIDAYIEERTNLVIDGIDDQTAIDHVAEKAKELQKMRTSLENKRKAMKGPINELDAWVRVPREALERAENKLRDQLAEVERKRNEQIEQQRQEEEAKYKKRCGILLQFGMSFNPVDAVWSINDGEATINDSIVRNSDSDVLKNLLLTRIVPISNRLAKEKEEAAKALEERRQAQEQQDAVNKEKSAEREERSKGILQKLRLAGAVVSASGEVVRVGSASFVIAELWCMTDDEVEASIARLMSPKKTEVVEGLPVDDLLDQHSADVQDVTEGNPEVLSGAESKDRQTCAQVLDQLVLIESLLNNMKTERGKHASIGIKPKLKYITDWVTGLQKEFT